MLADYILTFDELSAAVLIGAAGFVFAAILLQPGMIFSMYGAWLDRLATKPKRAGLAKMLGLCEACFSGQVALWFYVLLSDATGDMKSIIKLIFFISIAILSSKVFATYVRT